MREEKSEETIRLVSEPFVAVAVRPDELLLEGNVEIRPCNPCRMRLYVPTANLGKMVRCPSCNCEFRALVAAGPFADADFDSARYSRPEPPIELRPVGVPAASAPVIAPVVPYRRADPIDERSPMVDAVAHLQWIGGAFLIAVAIHQLGTFWKREYSAEGEELFTYATAAGRCLIAALSLAASSGIYSRSWKGWGLAFGLSALVTAGTGLMWVERAAGTGYRARFDFGVLLEMPPFLIAVFTLGILVVPRYIAEFRSNQTGTM